MRVRNDGLPLPEPDEVAVLHGYDLVRSDELPGIATRWLASGHPDSPSVAELAASDPHDAWGAESLLKQIARDLSPQSAVQRTDDERVVIEWVTETWRATGDTWWAVQTLARLGEEFPDFDLGVFVGYSDELAGGWGRLAPDLLQEAHAELGRRLA